MAKSVKSRQAAKGGKKHPQVPSEPWGSYILAYVLIVFVGISLLSFISRVYGGSHGNWMGPYLGEALAQNLAIVFGKLPSLIFLLTLAGAGARIIVADKAPWLTRITLGFASLLVWVSLLLSLRIEDFESVSSVHLEMNGGMLGVFLVKQVMVPVFGLSAIWPAILGFAGVIGTLFLAFGLKTAHFVPLVEWCKTQMNRQRAPRAKDPTIETSVQFAVQRNEDTSDFPVMRRGEVKPFEMQSFAAPPKAPEPLQSVAPAAPASQTMGRENLQIQQREALLQNARNMDPLEVRRLRDELAELRRANEINQWEDRKAGELKIELPVAPVKSRIEEEEKTLLAKGGEAPRRVQPQESPQIPENTREEVSIAMQKPMARKVQAPEENLFGEHSGEYRLPKVGSVLATVPEQPIDYSPDELKQFGTMLEQQLENFRVKGKVVHIATGPVITRFEIEPGPGVKVSRFASLSDDLALALKANSIRVLAPIPGKSVVGIEIPNRKSQTVYCREILESPRFMPNPETLQIVLGKDIMGNAFVMDLARAPHLLIAGQTGSGKSVCINTLMASMLFSKTPDELRMILVDPKVVELKSYEKIPHLLHPVVTDPGTAVQALQWACYEMDRRYELLAKAGVRNIAGFNKKLLAGDLDENAAIEDKDKQRMPFIVIVVDEFADVIMQAKKEFEDPVIRLAQKARAAGMHMVLATQRPSTNVITGIIKANLPTRISFKVASHIDARTVLDHAGAEKLLGRGDMLFRSIDDPEPVRVHGAFLTDTDAEQVAKACSEQDVHYPQLSSFQVASAESADSQDPVDSPDQDELFWDALELFVLQGGASTSLLQRRFSIGYSRAGRLMDQIYRAGFVGPERGSKPREVLISHEELGNLRRTRGV